MACFCENCAKKLGFKEDFKPFLCEGCGKYFNKVSVFKKVRLFITSINNAFS